MSDCARGTYVAPDTQRRFSTAAREWLLAQAVLKPRTRASYEALLFGKKSRLAAQFGQAAIANIRREDVRRPGSDAKDPVDVDFTQMTATSRSRGDAVATLARMALDLLAHRRPVDAAPLVEVPNLTD
jgi:hypothetical protein